MAATLWQHRSRLTLPAVLLLAAAIGLLTLLHSPPPDVDEAWNANRAWALLQTGRAFGTMDAGVMEAYEGYWHFFPLLGTAIHAVSIALLGPTLEAMRLTSLVFGLALVGAVYVIGVQTSPPPGARPPASSAFPRLSTPVERGNGGRRVGIVAALLVALSGPFLYSSHLGRHDIVVAALGFGAIALYLSDRPSGFPVKSLLAGLTLGLMPDIHLNGLIYGPVIGALFLHDHGWSLPRLLRAKRFWALMLGAGLGLAWFVAWHILPYPETYFTLSKMGPAPTRLPPVMTLDPRVWLKSLGETPLLLLVMNPGVAPFVVAGILPLMRRRSASDKRLLVLVGALAFTFVALIRVKLRFYTILISPAADLLAAAFLIDLYEKLSSGRSQRAISPWIAGAAAAGLLVAAGTFSARTVLRAPLDNYSLVLARVGEAISQDAAARGATARDVTVLGQQVYWFGFSPDQRHLSWEQILYYRLRQPGSTAEDALQALRPDYLIVDRGLKRLVQDNASILAPDFRHLHVPKGEFMRVLNERGQLVENVRSEAFGEIQIHRLDWGTQ